MIKVRMRDLALVAVAGGLLAFELVALGEALPVVKKALADRGWSAPPVVATASAADVSAPAVGTAASPVAQAVVGATTGRAQRIAIAKASKASTRCIAVARARDGQLARARVHLVSVKNDVACTSEAVALTAEKLREMEKAVDLALKHTAL